MSLVFNIDFSKGKSEIVEPIAKPKSVQQKTVFKIGPDLKVSCQKADLCYSPSKRLKGFVCGSNFSHRDRVCGCVEYCRLCGGLRSGKRGGHPI